MFSLAAKIGVAVPALAVVALCGLFTPAQGGQQGAKQANSTSAYVPLDPGPTPDEVNRRTLEARAGNDAAKMLLRSTPTGARITVDGLFVGKTPLLLIVAPGKYKIQMQNERQAFGERAVELGAKETQEVALTLAPKYPDRVTTH